MKVAAISDLHGSLPRTSTFQECEADICVVIGTNFNVYPTASLIGFPILFEDSKLLPGINCEIIRVRNNG